MRRNPIVRLINNVRDNTLASKLLRNSGFYSDPEHDVVNAKGARRKEQPVSVTRKISNKGISEYGSSMRGSWMPCPWDLALLGRAYETEGIFTRSINKFVELAWKNGFGFTGMMKDSDAVSYIQKRFEQIAMVTALPIKVLFNRMTLALVLYGNAYVSKVRNTEASGGKSRITFDGSTLVPVAGYFPQDPRWMEQDVASNGTPRMFRTNPIGPYATPTHWQSLVAPNRGLIQHRAVWRPRNMIHVPFLSAGGPFGMPMGWPIVDDIRALREGEEKLETLVYDTAYQTIHAKVGTDKHKGTDAEIRAVTDTLSSLPPGGIITTNERTELAPISRAHLSFDIVKALDYMMKRVAMGMGVSPVSLGDPSTANKSTGEVVTSEIRNTVKLIQNLVKTYVDEFMIKELLAEGGYYYDAYHLENKVELYVPEIDVTTQFQRENATNQLFLSNILTEPEARARLGMGPVAPEERGLMSTTLYPKGTSGQLGAVANKAQPRNQHGKLLGAPVHPEKGERTSWLPSLGEFTEALDTGTYSEWQDSVVDAVSDKVGEELPPSVLGALDDLNNGISVMDSVSDADNLRNIYDMFCIRVASACS